MKVDDLLVGARIEENSKITLPKDFDILTLSTLIKPLCIQ